MRFTAYSKYKPSGVEWLGEVPEDWDVKRGRFCMELNPQPVRLRELNSDHEVSFAPMEAVGEYGGLNLEQTRAITDIGSGYTEFEDGDVIVAKITPCFENGKGALAAGLTNGVGFGTTELHVLRARSVDRRFLFYLTISVPFRSNGKGEMYGAGGQKRVPPEFCKDFHVPLPGVEHQRAIANFLDRETSKLDTLVAKNKVLIDKLKEKRAALISRAVTRGLSPDAARAVGLDPQPKLKPSGVDWLGDFPEHWSAKALKFIASVGNGSTPSRENADYWWDGLYPWLNSSVVNKDQVTEGSDFVTDLALQQCHLPKVRPPAVLVGITGEGKTRGLATILMIEATINQHLAYVKPDRSIYEVRYLRRVFDRAYSYLRSESDGGGSTKGALTCEQLVNLKVPIPPLAEQRAIADYIDREATDIDNMVVKVEAALERLQEYRAALITAAVTGKIDVRGTTA